MKYYDNIVTDGGFGTITLDSDPLDVRIDGEIITDFTVKNNNPEIAKMEIKDGKLVITPCGSSEEEQEAFFTIEAGGYSKTLSAWCINKSWD